MAEWTPIIASIALAVIPVFIWLHLIRREGEEKGLYIKTFLLGTLAVIPPFVLILVFEWWPQLNIYSLITNSVREVALAVLFTNVIVGIIEEIAKNMIVRVIDKRHPEYIQNISAALRLSICAGLGFAFAENIFYFYNIWVSPEFGVQDLFATFVFRSAFTMLGHMVFSGIFGYYFGLGKFSADIVEHARWAGTGMHLTRFIARLAGTMSFKVLREQKNILGLFIAMAMHAGFNAALDLQHKLIPIFIVAGGAAYIAYLLQRKTGHLLFSLTKRRKSTMAPRDQDVVMELLGMWMKEGRLEEVIQICDRLLMRDPDNNVVKMFRAKAGDNEELCQCYHALKGLFKKEEAGIATAGSAPTLDEKNEKVVMEVMNKYYKEGKTSEVFDIANKLLARNPNSQGAKLLFKKAMSREKLERVFSSLSKLFKE